MRHHIDNTMVTLTVAAIQAHTGDPMSLASKPFVTQDDNSLVHLGDSCS